MTLLLLATWLPTRLVTSCLENARAPKQNKTGKKRAGQSCGDGSSVCAQLTGERVWENVCIKCGKVDFASDVQCGRQSGERVVLIVIAWRT